MFKGLNKGLDQLGKDISRVADQAGAKVTQAVDSNWRSGLLDNFRTGNVVQLISRSSGRAAQIVTSPTGQLVVDALGPEGPQYLHAHWTVLNEGKNVVRLYNQNNYIAIVNGVTCILQFADPSMTTPETRFRLKQISNFVLLESMKEHKRHIGFLKDGSLKSAIATGTEIDAHFGIRLIYSPYGAPAGAAGGATNAPAHK